MEVALDLRSLEKLVLHFGAHSCFEKNSAVKEENYSMPDPSSTVKQRRNLLNLFPRTGLSELDTRDRFV